MRIAVAKIFQETNTFNPLPFALEDFERFGIYFGDEVVDRLRAVGEVGGMLSVLSGTAGRVEVLPILAATSWAGGRWTRQALQYLEGKLLSGLREVQPTDGVLLSLHGAMAAEGIDDVTGRLLSSVRRTIGSHIPLVTTLDHHANLTPAIVASADTVVAYRECPHTDTFETGARAAVLLLRMLSGEVEPAVAWQKIPMLTPADRFWTAQPPLEQWFDTARQMETQPGVLSASLFPVQPWFDVPQLGWSTLVVTDRNQPFAQQLAQRLADQAWEMRHEFFGAELWSPQEAIRRAVEVEEGPVILADGSDNMNSGAPGDSTCLLKELLRQNVGCKVLIPMVDPAAVEQAVRAGVGSSVTLSLGGKRDAVFSRPVPVTGRVVRVAHGRISSTGHIPVDFNMGRTVLLAVGSINIVISEHPGPSHEPGVYRHLGEEPAQAKIVVIKTPVGFRAAYQSIMKDAMVVDCPGLSTPHLMSLDFVRVSRPLYPFDDIPDWRAADTPQPIAFPRTSPARPDKSTGADNA